MCSPPPLQASLVWVSMPLPSAVRGLHRHLVTCHKATGHTVEFFSWAIGCFLTNEMNPQGSPSHPSLKGVMQLLGRRADKDMYFLTSEGWRERQAPPTCLG